MAQTAKSALKKFKERMDSIRHGTCPICKKDWDSCPHNHQQMEEAYFRLRVKAVLK